MSDLVPRREAIRLLQADRRAIEAALAHLSARQLAAPGLGGGEWSPKDLLGHLESWEEHAMRALDAWSRGEPAPIDLALRSEGLTNINAEEVRRKAGRSVAKALSSSSGTHDALVAAIRSIPDPVWEAPPTRRSRTPLGVRLGQILTGPVEPFRHDQAHLGDLRAAGR
jgi:Arc/MetJ-type ribon-helix-helix transcriptional regulator